jgi:hypothetical protein
MMGLLLSGNPQTAVCLAEQIVEDAEIGPPSMVGDRRSSGRQRSGRQWQMAVAQCSCRRAEQGARGRFAA